MEETVGWKSLRAETFTGEILAFHILEMTPLSTNIDEPFLKDRILRFWNLTVSSTRTTITTQSPRGTVRERVICFATAIFYILLTRHGI
jgi:hypothetical protein